MKKISLVLSLVIAITFAASSISAKCYGFKDADIKVCVNGDGFKERKKAGDICKSKVLKRKNPKGKAYFICSQFPECEYMEYVV